MGTGVEYIKSARCIDLEYIGVGCAPRRGYGGQVQYRIDSFDMGCQCSGIEYFARAVIYFDGARVCPVDTADIEAIFNEMSRYGLADVSGTAGD